MSRRMVTEPLPEEEKIAALIVSKAYSCFGILVVIGMGLLGIAALGVILTRK